MYGETTPGVSAGSKSVGAREKWRARVICPSGAAKARAGAANTSASATTMMVVRRLIWTSAPVILTDRGRLSMDRRSGARAPDRLDGSLHRRRGSGGASIRRRQDHYCSCASHLAWVKIAAHRD